MCSQVPEESAPVQKRIYKHRMLVGNDFALGDDNRRHAHEIEGSLHIPCAQNMQ